ncbi:MULTISPECIES: TetR/AcrR family transcriptional regulator [Chitinophagaceae]
MSLDRTRKEILLAAQKLFQENGLHNITMEDIAKAIGKGKSSLYYYFKSKEEIFSAVLEMEINDIILETMKRLGKVHGFGEKLECFGKTKFEMVRKRKSLYVMMETGLDADEMVHYQQMKHIAHLNYVEKEKTLLLQIWIDAMASNTIPSMDNDELERTILLFLCALRGINREAIITDTPDYAPVLIIALSNLFAKE